MYRAVVTAAAAVALVIGGVSPAMAAPSSSVPGAPTSVKVTGAADSATVTWSAPKSGAKVTGWRVAVTPAERQPDKGVDRLPPVARSDRFGALTPRTQYTFSVRAVGARGTGPAVAVRYTAPTSVRTVQSLFALDGTGAVVRYPTSGTGAPKTVAPNGTGYTADDVGDVFVPSADRTSIVMYPADGSAARTIASGLHLSADLRSDVAGNLYWADSVSGAVTKLPVTGGTPVAIIPSHGTAWAVGRDGTVSAFTVAAPMTTTATVVSVAPNGTKTTRAVEQPGYSFPTGLLADGSGTLYFGFGSTGASGATRWEVLPAGTSTLVAGVPRGGFEYAATNDKSFLLAQSEGWCAAPADASPTGCQADKTVRHLFSRALDGTIVDRTTSGVTSEGRGMHVGAADVAGDVFIDVASGATPGLWRLPAAGGVAQQLSTGQFTRLLVI